MIKMFYNGDRNDILYFDKSFFLMITATRRKNNFYEEDICIYLIASWTCINSFYKIGLVLCF